MIHCPHSYSASIENTYMEANNLKPPLYRLTGNEAEMILYCTRADSGSYVRLFLATEHLTFSPVLSLSLPLLLLL